MTTLAGLTYDESALPDAQSTIGNLGSLSIHTKAFGLGVPFSAAVSTTDATAGQNSGDWTIVPGVLTIKWSYDAQSGTASVKVVFLFWTIDALTGTLTSTSASLEDNLDFGILKGDLKVEADFGSGGGIVVSGDLTVFGKPDGSFNKKVVSW